MDDTELVLSENNETIDKWNRSKGEAKGDWVYSKEHGIVWLPQPGDKMGGNETPPESGPPPILNDILEWGKSFTLEDVKENSVLVIKISASSNPMRAAMLQKGIIEMVLSPRAEQLKDKKITVLFLSSEDDVSLLTEEDMNATGWEKKEKSLIIKPF